MCMLRNDMLILLNARPHPWSALRDKLEAKGFSPAASEWALASTKVCTIGNRQSATTQIETCLCFFPIYRVLQLEEYLLIVSQSLFIRLKYPLTM